jgi:hypothetical protein
MNPRKRSTTIMIAAAKLVIGQYIRTNSGDIVEVTPAIKRALPGHVEVCAYEA